MIEIDGSFGEGGGQIIRSSLALSLLTGKPFRLVNIRARRKPKPGLQPQHLMSVRAAATIGHAKIRGDSIGSTVLTFEPGPIQAGNYRFAIGTAGATSLVLHTIYLPLMLQGKAHMEITLEGGTHVSKSPCFHFLNTTWLAYMRRIGLNLRLEMEQPGFYPRGGGKVVAYLSPCERIQGLHLTRMVEHTKASGFSSRADLPEHVAKRQARRIVERLRRVGIEAELQQQIWSNGPGSVLGITLDDAPIPTSFYALGEKGKPAEAVADEVAEEAIAYISTKYPVDEHSADQLILPLAFSEEASEFHVAKVSLHLSTNITVIRMFVDREITWEGEEGSTGIVRIPAKWL